MTSVMGLTLALVVAAASVGAIHTVAPDHWVPFVALARAQRWSSARTALVTGLCGLGHVTVSAVLGLASAWFGLELIQAFGRRLEAVAGVLMIGFGVVYALWSVHARLRGGWHAHPNGHVHWHRGSHSHGHLNHPGHRDQREQAFPASSVRPVVCASDRPRMTAWALFLVFSADPCVAVIPLIFAAAPLGWASVVPVVAAYEVATIGTMITLVLPARAVASAAGGGWADRYGDALAGGVIAATGLVVAGFGW